MANALFKAKELLEKWQSASGCDPAVWLEALSALVDETERLRAKYVPRYAAQFLGGIRPETLTPFEERDPLNPQNIVSGYLCHQADHRYGALVILQVNGNDAEQVIYATPKLHYPFTNDVQQNTRRYHWPVCERGVLMEKWDGTSVCQYSYTNHRGEHFVTAKVRLGPFLRNGKFGAFLDMWKEMVQQTGLIAPPEVASGDIALCYEMYGYRNLITVKYPFPLKITLLFGVRQKDAAPLIPEECPESLAAFRNPVEAVVDSAADLTAFYEKAREEAGKNCQESKTDEGKLEGTEGHVLYLLTDDKRFVSDKRWMLLKCFDPRTSVLTSKGWVKLLRIVEDRMHLKVLTVRRHGPRYRLEWKRVIGWFKSRREGRQMVRLRLTHAPANFAVNVTEEHEFYTQRGYVRVKDLQPSDRICVGELAPTEKQLQLIHGSLLGDGTIDHVDDSGDAAFSVSHSDIGYAQMKWQLLRDLGARKSRVDMRKYNKNARPRMDVVIDSRNWTRQERLRWYPEGVKCVPRDLKLTNFLLAVWFMDDGHMACKHAGRPDSSIATCDFCDEDLRFLQKLLEENGLPSTVGKQRSLHFGVDATETLIAKIRPYVPACMAHKLPPGKIQFDPHGWQPLAPGRTAALGQSPAPLVRFDTFEILPTTFPLKEDWLYCLDVADNHNFVTRAGVAHNCKPEQVESIHWSTDRPSYRSILPTAWNALETLEPEALTYDVMKQLLLEEFAEDKIEDAKPLIEKAIAEVRSVLAFRTAVKATFDAAPDKSNRQVLMRYMAGVVDSLAEHMKRLYPKAHRGKWMQVVFGALLQQGLIREDLPKAAQSTTPD